MRITGPSGLSTVATTPAARRSASGTFQLESESSGRASGTTSLRTVGGIDALIALQGCEDPTERRRRAIKRGRVALDALDDLKLSLLSGGIDPSALARLRTAAGALDERSGDERLDMVLAEIELRVEVEIAKLEGPRHKTVP